MERGDDSSDDSDRVSGNDGNLTSVDRSTSASSLAFIIPQVEETEKIKDERQGCEDAKGFDAEAIVNQDLGDDN